MKIIQDFIAAQPWWWFVIIAIWVIMVILYIVAREWNLLILFIIGSITGLVLAEVARRLL